VPGAGDGQLNHPTDVAAAPDGRVYVTDSGAQRVQYFLPAGGFLGSFGSPGSGPGQFSDPRGIAVVRV